MVQNKEGLDLTINFPCKYLTQNELDWHHVLQGINTYDVVFVTSVIQYYQAYFIDSYEEYYDYSMILYNKNDEAIAVWPLCVYFHEGCYHIGSNGGAIVFPIILDELYNTKSHKKISDTCFQIIKALAAHYHISEMNILADPLVYPQDCFYEKLLTYDVRPNYHQHMLYVNFQKGMDHVKANIRKSYRSLIHGSKKNLNIEIIDCKQGNVKQALAQTKQLHLEVAGQKTRSDQSWLLQEKIIVDGYGCIFLLYDKDQQLVGAAIFSWGAKIAHYGTGVYRRELFDQYALGHVVQSVAIDYMYSHDIQWYCIGGFPLLCDAPKPTDKEISIGHFKQGFATDIMITNMILMKLI